MAVRSHAEPASANAVAEALPEAGGVGQLPPRMAAELDIVRSSVDLRSALRKRTRRQAEEEGGGTKTVAQGTDAAKPKKFARKATNWL